MNDGRIVTLSIRVMTLLLLLAGSSQALRGAGPIDTLKPGTWYEVPNSHLRSVDPCPSHTCGYSAVEGISAVMDDWSGGAYDTKRDRLIIWGGGHGGYAGNELYAFDVNTLAWKRLNSPSDPPGVDVAYAPDGAPTSRHTYNYIQYLPPPVDRFCSFGGSAFYVTGQTGTRHVDAFNFDTVKWETGKFADTPASNLIGSMTAVDPATGHVWQLGGLSTYLAEFDPSLNKWTAHGDQWSGDYNDYRKTADIDSKRHRLLAAGGGEVWSWKLDLPGTSVGTKLTTTGATEILNGQTPGLVYVPTVDRFVAWNGGAAVYVLDPETLVWSRIAPDPANAAIPGGPNGNGTFGRFRYMPSKNAFIVVNGVDQNVFLYKLPSGIGTPDVTPPSVPANLQVVANGAGSMTLTWSASTDSGGVAGYRIYRDGVLVGTATTSSYADTALSSSTAYAYSVSAVDAAGNESARSASVGGTTGPGSGGSGGSSSGGGRCGSVGMDLLGAAVLLWSLRGVFRRFQNTA